MTDPVAEVLARVLVEHDLTDEPGWSRVVIAGRLADALREAGLIPEATTRVEWRLKVGPIGYVESFDEQGIKAMAAWRGESVSRRVRTTYASDRYADRVTEWEAVE